MLFGKMKKKYEGFKEKKEQKADMRLAEQATKAKKEQERLKARQGYLKSIQKTQQMKERNEKLKQKTRGSSGAYTKAKKLGKAMDEGVLGMGVLGEGSGKKKVSDPLESDWGFGIGGGSSKSYSGKTKKKGKKRKTKPKQSYDPFKL